MAKLLEELSITEVVALNKATDIIIEKYQNLYEMHRGNSYGDTEGSSDERVNALATLDNIKRRKEKILQELEKRIYDAF